uniref:RRM domain-containing protein n=1 Tax=Macrostomum lignano TaxID=282301 RepID=A0A1I8GGF0_9PLAT
DAAETSKVPPSGDAEETSKVPPSGDAEETSKVPPSGDAEETSKVNKAAEPAGTGASAVPTVNATSNPKPPPPAALLEANGGTHNAVAASTSGHIQRTDSCQGICAAADSSVTGGTLRKATTCPTDLSASAVSSGAVINQRPAGPPPIDSKTVLVFSGSGATPTAKVSKQLSLKRMQKKLQSSLFVSRFPEDANLNNMRAYASHSDEYLYKWTRLYFCPVSAQVAEEIQCQHFLVSNLSQSLLRSPSDLLIKFSQTMPTARSFFLPVDESESPLGYMLVRFNKSEDCLACYRLLQKHYSMEMTFVSLLEVCQLPGGFLVPAHNLLNWCRLEKPAASSASLSQPRIVLDDPVRSPYLCTCHPAAQTVAPPPEKLHILANELENAMGNPSAIVDFKSVLLRLC